MALCKNKQCRTQLGAFHWLDGYCSEQCARVDNDADWEDCRPLYDPTDPTGQRVIAQNLDEVDAMLAAAEIDPRLPKLIYLRKRGMTHRAIGQSMQPRIRESTVRKIINLCDRNLLIACGLRK